MSSRVHHLRLSENDQTYGEYQDVLHFAGFVFTVGRLLRNPIYLVLSLSTVVNLLGVAGMMSFMPKYLASQYTVPLWQANIIMCKLLSGVHKHHGNSLV